MSGIEVMRHSVDGYSFLRLFDVRATVWLLAVVWSSQLVAPGMCAVVVARNGMILDGKLGYQPSIDENPFIASGADRINQVVLVDDGLRRTFLSYRQLENAGESEPGGFERIRIKQHVARGRRQIGSVTAIQHIGKFDRHGRRRFSILTPRGPENIFQGITEITPLYTKVQGLSGVPSIQWDCRIATSSIPRATLSQVLRLQAFENGPDARIAAVRLFFESERYNDARIELEEAMREFPELSDMQELLVQLRQYSARRLVDEIELRQAAGQHNRVEKLLSHFPEQGVATETLQRVSELLRARELQSKGIERLLADLRRLCDSVSDPTLKPEIAQIRQEIERELNLNSRSRLQDFERLQSDPNMTDETRLSLLLSGWVIGAGNATQNLPEALSLFRTRDLVLRYLRADLAEQRTQVLSQLGREEGGTPQHIAQILRHLRPPIASETQAERPPGNFLFYLDTAAAGRVAYEVQLPDEYDPFRRYPTIVTLHARGRTPSDQIDWWAGSYDADRSLRAGQATRRGYIVVAPHWLPSGQQKYEYSGREHARVLSTVRDACRRFSVDTDRIYLSGHSVGGDAAWDIGLAHPDQWAGVIPLVAVCDYGSDAPKYISHYWTNARRVPLYFVTGELDGNKLEMNRRDFNRYLTNSNLDVMITEYIGRGHEHFYEEIHRIFAWLELQRRDFYPESYECVTMRSFDNFFYNLELTSLPSASIVGPYEWPASAKPAENSFKKTAVGSLRIQTGAVEARLWLSPEIVDLNGRVAIDVNGRSRAYEVTPKVQVLLEDARTRADRLHPFWAEVQLTTGKREAR